MNCGISNQPEPSCWECQHFDPPPHLDRDQPPEEECQQGECLRYPPVTDHDHRDTQVNYAVFPIVIACDRCGEFSPRRPTLPRSREDEANAAFDAAAPRRRDTRPRGGPHGPMPTAARSLARPPRLGTSRRLKRLPGPREQRPITGELVSSVRTCADRRTLTN